MVNDQPTFSRASFNPQTRNRDIYSYEYLSRPFSIDDTTLPQLNTNQGSNNTGVANALYTSPRSQEQVNRNKATEQSIYGGLYAAGRALPKQDYNSDFGSQSDTLKKRKGVESGFDTGEQVASAIPGVGTAVAAFSQIGRGVGAETVDENGIYKSKVGAAVDSNMNPVSGVSGVIGIATDVFDGGGIDYDNIGNFATMNLFGKSASQTALKKEKKEFDTRKMYGKVAANQTLGATGGSESYKAVPYGKKGMKIKTKLSNF